MTNTEFLASGEADRHITDGASVSLPGPAKIKETYSKNVLKLGETESTGGQTADQSDSGNTLRCQDELSGCKVFIMFTPESDGVSLSMDVIPTKAADEAPLQQATNKQDLESYASGVSVAMGMVAIALSTQL